MRGFVDEETFRESGRRIAVLLHSAAEVGATGEVHFVGVGAHLHLILTLDGTQSWLTRDPRNLERSPDVEELVGESLQRGAKRSEKAIRSFSQLGATATAAREKAIERLRAASREQLEAALAAAKELTGARLPSDAARVLALLSTRLHKVDLQDGSALPGIPITLLSFVDPAAAEPLALSILAGKAPDSVRVHAALALGQTSSDAALDMLVKLAMIVPHVRAPSCVPTAATRALAVMKHPRVGARLAEMLSVAVESVPERLRSPADSMRLSRAVELLDVVAVRRQRKLLPYCARLAQSFSPVRYAAAIAVLRLASDAEFQRAFGMSQDAFARKHAPAGDLRLVPRAGEHARKLAKMVSSQRPSVSQKSHCLVRTPI